MKSSLPLLSLFGTILALTAANGCTPETKTELATVCIEELCGYVNSQGHWQIPPKFRAADPFSKDGLARVIVTDGSFKSDVYLTDHGGTYSNMPYEGSLGLIDVNGDFELVRK